MGPSAGRTFVIAEAGVNHNGDLALAKRLVEVAARAGADVVKFQSFRADALARRDTPKAGYQVETTGSGEGQLAMLKALELSVADHHALVACCREHGIGFLSTPFDEESADLLDALGVPLFKVPSGEVTNLLLLRHVAAKRKPVILSTGMSTLDEVGAAVDALERGGAPSVTLLHCVSDYPTRLEDLNLRALATLAVRFGRPVGLSDHSQGITAPIAAVALGATVIEKHFTLDRSMPGPDHRASLDPAELVAMVAAIRDVERALGDGVRRLTPGEVANRAVVRRSLVAARDLEAGRALAPGDVLAKRPADGISPMELESVLGRRLTRAVSRDEPIPRDALGGAP